MNATSGPIQYRSGYKYQLCADWWVQTPITGHEATVPGFINLALDGKLTIHTGYAWDGPSGPTIDTKTFMRGSLAHDALYQLMREGLISESLREDADRLLMALCVQDGMNAVRAACVYAAVRECGGPSAKRQAAHMITAGMP